MKKLSPFLIFFFLVLFIAFLVIRPYISDLIVAATLAYIFYPAYFWLNKRLKNSNLSAAIITFIVIVASILVTFMLIKAVVPEAKTAFELFQNATKSVDCENSPNLLCQTTGYYDNAAPGSSVKPFEGMVTAIASSLITKASNFVISIPERIISLFVIFFAMYYLFKEGKILVEKIKKLLPMSKQKEEEIIRKLNSTTFAVVYGTLIVAIIQGAVATLGYAIFGISYPIIWGILTVFAVFAPLIGTGLIWIPLSLVRVVEGIVNNNPSLIWVGAGLFIYGSLVIGLIDNLIKPKIIGDRASIHPIVVLVGIVGGMKLFGFIGFIVGPVILGLMISLLSIYERGGFDEA